LASKTTNNIFSMPGDAAGSDYGGTPIITTLFVLFTKYCFITFYEVYCYYLYR